MQYSFIKTDDNRKIAYSLSEGKSPCVIFLGGFKSDMTGTKATAIEAACKEVGQRFIRFDYGGHGKSEGRFEDGTIGSWKKDALLVLDKLGAESNILVGSSMGAWIALLCALERKEKVSALIGIAGAPDFTEKLIWEKFTPKQKEQIKKTGIYYAPSCYGEEPYPITLKLIEEARNHLLLDAEIAIDIPIRLFQGMEDTDVPWQTSVTLAQKLYSKDVILTFIKDGDHRLSSPKQLEIVINSIKELCK